MIDIDSYIYDCLKFRTEEFATIVDAFNEFKDEDIEFVEELLEATREQIVDRLCELASIEYGVDSLVVLEAAEDLDVLSVLYEEQ